MTSLVRIVCSPFAQLLSLAAIVTIVAVTLTRTSPAVVVIVSPTVAAPPPARFEVFVPYCYGWSARWSSVDLRPYCRD